VEKFAKVVGVTLNKGFLSCLYISKGAVESAVNSNQPTIKDDSMVICYYSSW